MTILISEEGNFTKSYDKNLNKKSFNNIYKTKMASFQPKNINELKKSIDFCISKGGCLCPGNVIDEDNFLTPKRRLLKDADNGDKATLTNDRYDVLCIDIDNTPNPYDITKDYNNHLKHIIDQLRKIDTGFIDTDFLIQFSASSGIKKGSNAHIFYILEDNNINYKKISNIFNNLNKKAKELKLDIRFDNSVNTGTQPIYVSVDFEDNSLNPLADEKRIKVFTRSNKKLKLPEWFLVEKEKVEVHGIEKINENPFDVIEKYHIIKAKEIFESKSSSIQGLGAFVTFLKNKGYSYDSVETLWNGYYSGNNFTLVKSSKHSYDKFKDTWEAIPFITYDFFDHKNLSKNTKEIFITTDTRKINKEHHIIIPSYTFVNLKKLEKKIGFLPFKKIFIFSNKIPKETQGGIAKNICITFENSNIELKKI